MNERQEQDALWEVTDFYLAGHGQGCKQSCAAAAESLHEKILKKQNVCWECKAVQQSCPDLQDVWTLLGSSNILPTATTNGIDNNYRRTLLDVIVHWNGAALRRGLGQTSNFYSPEK